MGVKIGLILLACVAVCSGRSVFSDKCTLMPNPNPAGGTFLDVDANKDCTVGTVMWSYPGHYLRVHFKQNNPSAVFKLCIVDYDFFHKISDERTGAIVPKPNSGSDSCVDSTNGEVTLRFDSGTGIYYMHKAKYIIQKS